MKATPKLLQQALRVLEIGLSHEIASKILATVRLLDEKGDSADLKDFALIEATCTEKIEPESVLLQSDEADLSLLEAGDTVYYQFGGSAVVVSYFPYDSGNEFNIETTLTFEKYRKDGECITTNGNGNLQPEYNIVKIIKPTKPQ